MYPIIFKIGILEARSYYMLWAFALYLFINLTSLRCEKIYGIDREKADNVLFYMAIAGILGSSAASALSRMPLYLAGRISFLEMFEGLASHGGMLAGSIVCFIKLKQLGISLEDFSEAMSIPAAVMLSVGRIGCFLEGCCRGVGKICANPPWWAVHFPDDSRRFFSHPTQLYECILCLILLIIFILTEKHLIKAKHGIKCAILFPFFMLAYSIYRICVAHIRIWQNDWQPFEAGIVWICGIILAIIWLFWSIRMMKISKHSSQLQ